LDVLSPLKERHDVESDVLTGFPYSLVHASALALCLANLSQRLTPKKGIITDLDDTLWRGVLGEDGVDRISWDLDHHSQMHALYQRFLGALASEGVLIGVASKNDPSLVEEALRREDLALSPSVIFPIEANWGPKSESVAGILRAWNVGPDSVVYVDDSPFELAEVRASHPEIECLQFPTKDSVGVYSLILHLRDMCGKRAILEEDTIRIESIQRLQRSPDGHDAGATMQSGFSADVAGEVSVTFNKVPLDPRALELVNKTNQFNLNGRRYTEASWRTNILRPESVLLLASYQDKFGPLGKVVVLAGRKEGKRLIVATLVMSCRAFSRHIEYKCLAQLLSECDLDEIEFEYMQTDRNGPLRDFLKVITGSDPSPGCTVSRKELEGRLNTLLEAQEVRNG
jgi:FkbH-like protein